MKSIIFAVLALVSLAAAWGSVEFCVHNWDVNGGYECATYSFGSPGCFNLPDLDGSFGQPKLRNNTRYVALSTDIMCTVYSDVGCTGKSLAHLVRGQYHEGVDFDFCVSSVSCEG